MNRRRRKISFELRRDLESVMSSAATIETVNADLRARRGMQQLPVRGVTKVRTLAMLYALTLNILRLPRSLLRL